MKIAILGYGEQGRFAYEYWGNSGNEITICDKNAEMDLPEETSGQLGGGYLEGLDHFDLIVRSPSILPEDIIKHNSPEILKKTTSVTNEFFKVCPTKNIIGVTGTKGKGTTSTLIAKMLDAAGKRTHLGGNIGVPPLDLLSGAGALHGDAMQGADEERTEPYKKYGEGALESATQQSAPSFGRVAGSASQQDRAMQSIQPDDWVVLELANFQLIDLGQSPHIAVCLMVAPEHLDWHPHEQHYYLSKKQLFKFQSENDIAIYFPENSISQEIASEGNGKKLPYYQKPGAVIENENLVIDDQIICPVSNFKLPGEHNWQNICAATTAFWQAVQNAGAVKTVVTTFSGLPYRLEMVRELHGVKYYNDSFGTTPETAQVAIEAFPAPKILILGGSDKGSDYSGLAQNIAKSNIKKVLLIGQMADRIRTELDNCGYTNYVNGGETIEEIAKNAQSNAEPGDIVLFSTACASFDMFKNYKDRGDKFTRAVKELS